MSDEFNVDGRTFADGDDPTWTALDKTDVDQSNGGGGSLHFYNSSMITTKDGQLKISTNLEKTKWNVKNRLNGEKEEVVKDYKSGMLQSWNKFCFTGGIMEVDVIFPGEPLIGGLWPAIWLLGNLGRATYEGSTNRLWPWSYDKCDRKLQKAQMISACNSINHYGLNSNQGRGATEIDLVEVMPGYNTGWGNVPLPNTFPPIRYPYADMTLQIAPGVPNNRPSMGYMPLRQNLISGHMEYLSQTWYEGLTIGGACSLNPYFYGTYLGETSPNEPVTRTKEEAFQADAVGAMYQLNTDHFKRHHTFRLEWQPGKNGRIDWFAKNSLTGQWEKSYTIKDQSLSSLTGSQIPAEPSSLIFNTAVSSTWSFPNDSPDWCPKCYDCSNVTCSCAFYPGFCKMLNNTNVEMSIDFVRIYQSTNHSAHVGNPHTIGCDPPEYPTRTFIKANEHLYMREDPFGKLDEGALKDIVHGGGKCETNSDCGGIDNPPANSSESQPIKGDRGRCIAESATIQKCQCSERYTGPYCKVENHRDPYPGAREIELESSIFNNTPRPIMPKHLVFFFVFISLIFFTGMYLNVRRRRKEMQGILRSRYGNPYIRKHSYRASGELTETGRSI